MSSHKIWLLLQICGGIWDWNPEMKKRKIMDWMVVWICLPDIIILQCFWSFQLTLRHPRIFLIRAFELEWMTCLELQVKMKMVFMYYCDYYELDIVTYYEIKPVGKRTYHNSTSKSLWFIYSGGNIEQSLSCWPVLQICSCSWELLVKLVFL